jgi:hypothetical protein
VPWARKLGAARAPGRRGENLDEGLADDFAFALRIGHALEAAEKEAGGVAVLQFDFEMAPENLAHDRRLARAQQAIVDKNAGQPAAEGLVQQGRRHARIHSAAQAQDDPFPAGLGLDFLHRLVGEMAHGPVPAAAADAVDEIGDDFAPARRVGHFRVKLQPVKIPGGVFNGGELRVVRGGHGLEAFGHPGQFVPVRIPDLQVVGQAGKQRGRRVLDQQRALAVFAFLAGFDLAAQKMGEQLHAVANPQDGDAQFENGAVRHGGALA